MNAGQTDEELLAAYAAGDARAFGELYERHERPVFRYFLRQGAAAALAEDLLQETWMAVIRNAERFEPRAKFTTWLYTVARSKMIDHWRGQDDAVSLDDAANDPDDAPLDVAGSDADRPDVRAVSRAQARAFVEAVRGTARRAARGVPATGRGRPVAREEIAVVTQAGRKGQEPAALRDDETAGAMEEWK